MLLVIISHTSNIMYVYNVYLSINLSISLSLYISIYIYTYILGSCQSEFRERRRASKRKGFCIKVRHSWNRFAFQDNILNIVQPSKTSEHIWSTIQDQQLYVILFKCPPGGRYSQPLLQPRLQSLVRLTNPPSEPPWAPQSPLISKPQDLSVQSESPRPSNDMTCGFSLCKMHQTLQSRSIFPGWNNRKPATPGAVLTSVGDFS